MTGTRVAMTESNAVLASVWSIPVKVIKILTPNYQIADPLPWAQLAGPLAAAEDTVARLDERLAKSPIRDGAISRTHFADACASLWLDGELVHLDDLVLHDAGMDVRTPTHELTRAHAVLRARRRIAEAKPDWALSNAGLAVLRGQGERDEKKGTGKNDEGSFGGGNEGAESMSQLLVLDEPPTAVFAHSDEVAAGAIRTLRRAGLTPGRDISIIGIDDHPIANLLDLSTIRQRPDEQGRRAARLLLDLLGHRDAGPVHLTLPTELVVRGSTERPRRT